MFITNDLPLSWRSRSRRCYKCYRTRRDIRSLIYQNALIWVSSRRYCIFLDVFHFLFILILSYFERWSEYETEFVYLNRTSLASHLVNSKWIDCFRVIIVLYVCIVHILFESIVLCIKSKKKYRATYQMTIKFGWQ